AGEFHEQMVRPGPAGARADVRDPDVRQVGYRANGSGGLTGDAATSGNVATGNIAAANIRGNGHQLAATATTPASSSGRPCVLPPDLPSPTAIIQPLS